MCPQHFSLSRSLAPCSYFTSVAADTPSFNPKDARNPLFFKRITGVSARCCCCLADDVRRKLLFSIKLHQQPAGHTHARSLNRGFLLPLLLRLRSTLAIDYCATFLQTIFLDTIHWVISFSLFLDFDNDPSL